MSYQTWSNQGYGIMTDEIHTTTKKIWELIELAPDFLDYCKHWAADFTEKPLDDFENFKDSITLEDFETEFYGNCGEMCGLATILAEVIREKEDIYMFSCDDYDDNFYLLHPNTQPWDMSDKERNLTIEDFDEMLNKYIRILTDEEVTIDYYAAENGG